MYKKFLLASREKILESDIEKHFIKYAKQKQCWATKIVLLNGCGFPDRTVLCPGGKIFFIEFKRKGLKLSPLQNSIKTQIEALGFLYFVCDEIGQAEKILNDIVETT